MAEDWSQAARDVDAGMREAGQLLTFTAPGTPGVFDPATETTTGASPPATHMAYGAQGRAYSAFNISTGLVAAGDVRLMLSTLKEDGSVLPEPVPDAWTVVLNGKTHTVKWLEKTEPAGSPVLYELRLRA